mgnify:CR=1 FL=1
MYDLTDYDSDFEDSAAEAAPFNRFLGLSDDYYAAFVQFMLLLHVVGLSMMALSEVPTYQFSTASVLLQLLWSFVFTAWGYNVDYARDLTIVQLPVYAVLWLFFGRENLA